MSLADIFPILNVWIYAPDIKEETPYESHGKMIEFPGRVNIADVLKNEFGPERGAVLVSSKYLG